MEPADPAIVAQRHPPRLRGWPALIVTALGAMTLMAGAAAWWLGDDGAITAAAERAEARFGSPASTAVAASAPSRIAAAAAAFAAVGRLSGWDDARNAIWNARDDADWSAARGRLDGAEVAAALDAIAALAPDPMLTGPSLLSERDQAVRLLTLCVRGGDEAESARAELIALALPPRAWSGGLESTVTRQRLECLDAIARRPPRDHAAALAVAAAIDAAADAGIAALRRDAPMLVTRIAAAAKRADPFWEIGRTMGFQLNVVEEWRVARQMDAKLHLAGDIDALVGIAAAVAEAVDAQDILRSVPYVDPRVFGAWQLHANLRLLADNSFAASARRLLLARAIANHLRGEPLAEDPFARGTPLRAVVDDGRLVAVWSVGRDGHDDGGGSGDIVLLRRPRPK